MKIAILGTGPIGSTFAIHLAKNHDVTCIARNKRLEQLQKDGGIRLENDEIVAVTVEGTLNVDVEYDLLLVTVLNHQLAPLIPQLSASKAKEIMLMFNTFDSLAQYRKEISHKVIFGFPAILATLPDGKLHYQIVHRGQTTISESETWAKVFTEAGITTSVETDFESWLKTHAALLIPLMFMCCKAFKQGHGVSWQDSQLYAKAFHQAHAVVSTLGFQIIPRTAKVFNALPQTMLAGVLYGITRLPIVAQIGTIGSAEPEALLKSMLDQAKTLKVPIDALETIRPE